MAGNQVADADLEPLLDVAAAARLLGIRDDAIYRLVEAGRLPHIRLSERRIRFLSSDLRAFIEARRQG